MMSVRGSSPNIASDRVTDPASLPSSVVTFISISRTLPADRDGGRGRIIRETELARLGDAIGQLLLHRITHRNPAALDARHRTLDQDQAARDIGLHDFEIERGHALNAQMTRHFLVLEGPARILPATGAADRTVRDRHAVRGAETGKIPALHGAGPALAGRGAGDIDILADDKMIGGDFGADRHQPIFVNAKLGELALGLDLGDRKVTAVGL